MAYDSFQTGANAIFKIDVTQGGSLVDISACINSVDRSGTKDMKDIARIGGNQTVQVPGPAKTEWKLKVWATIDSVAIFDSASMTAGTATRSVEWSPFGSATGSPKYTGEILIGTLSWSTTSEDPQSFDVTVAFQGTGVTIGSY